MQGAKKDKKEEGQMQDQKKMISVTLHVFSTKTRQKLKIDKNLKSQVDTAVKDIMKKVSSSDNLAKRLSIPSDTPVKWNVEITAIAKGLITFEGHIPMMVSVAGIPKIMENLHGAVMEEVTNTLFDAVRAHPSVSKDVAKALVYDTHKPVKFRVYLPDQLRVRESARGLTIGDCDCDCDCDCPSYDCDCYDCGGWSKG